jgi:hypothetical protein
MLPGYPQLLPQMHTARVQHQAPLNELCRELKNDRQMTTSAPTAESAFQNCKTSLAQAALLFHPYPNSPLTLATDTSNVIIGASVEEKCDGQGNLLDSSHGSLLPQKPGTTYTIWNY